MMDDFPQVRFEQCSCFILRALRQPSIEDEKIGQQLDLHVELAHHAYSFEYEVVEL